LRVVRIYADAVGISHLEEMRIALADDNLGRISLSLAAGEGAFLRELRAGLFVDFHRAPRRQLVVVVNGNVEVEAGDGTTAVAGPVEAIFVEDTSGQGHITRVGAAGAATCIYIPVAAQFDIRTICG
jgi:hypothetical protein